MVVRDQERRSGSSMEFGFGAQYFLYACHTIQGVLFLHSEEGNKRIGDLCSQPVYVITVVRTRNRCAGNRCTFENMGQRHTLRRE